MPYPLQFLDGHRHTAVPFDAGDDITVHVLEQPPCSSLNTLDMHAVQHALVVHYIKDF